MKIGLAFRIFNEIFESCSQLPYDRIQKKIVEEQNNIKVCLEYERYTPRMPSAIVTGDCNLLGAENKEFVEFLHIVIKKRLFFKRMLVR
mmetsp:Transcript_3646/g.5337  ORF Transcript_3646/g.5337 Transcript_3646/m.5337 type:complete len:89 (+) Transcript_3646:61-327(+)